MARRRFVVFLCLILLMPYTPFLLERPTPTAYTAPAPPDINQDWDYPERVQEGAKYFLTSTFPIHAAWIVALVVLSIVTLADIFMKLVFTCCRFGIEAVTGHQNTRFFCLNTVFIASVAAQGCRVSSHMPFETI